MAPWVLAEGDIDKFILLDIEVMRCTTFGSVFALTSNRCQGLLSLCISDAAKLMLIGNSGLAPHLIDGLLLDPEHPRKDTDQTIKAAIQRDFAECIQQISLFPPGAQLLKADGAVVPALDALVDKAWTEEAKDCARGALMQLTDRKRETIVAIDTDALHIMMSCECGAALLLLLLLVSACAVCGFGPAVDCCARPTHVYVAVCGRVWLTRGCAAVLEDQWDVQPTVERIVAALQADGYDVWFDRKCCTHVAIPGWLPTISSLVMKTS